MSLNHGVRHFFNFQLKLPLLYVKVKRLPSGPGQVAVRERQASLLHKTGVDVVPTQRATPQHHQADVRNTVTLGGVLLKLEICIELTLQR